MERVSSRGQPACSRTGKKPKTEPSRTSLCSRAQVFEQAVGFLAEGSPFLSPFEQRTMPLFESLLIRLGPGIARASFPLGNYLFLRALGKYRGLSLC
ncbi:MAG: hypothetical protein DRN03_06155 [Thermoplasmata archaeon]|nr:MAG: hypothetical protein DRN03_06155 [Thermoplasmata archaeon]